jgi:hypothetical protein
MKRIRRSDAKKQAASAKRVKTPSMIGIILFGGRIVDRAQELVQFRDVTSPLVMATRGAFVGEYTTKSSIMSREKLELERKDKAKSMKIIESGSSEKGSTHNGRNPIKAPAQREVEDGLDKNHSGILTQRMGLKDCQGRRMGTDSYSLPIHTPETGDAVSIQIARRVLRSDAKIMAPSAKTNEDYHHYSDHRCL